MVSSTVADSGVVTVTVTPTATIASAATTLADNADTTSSTMSLIYIYSAATTAAQPTSTSSSSANHGLSGGAIAGIVVGSVVFLALLAISLFCYSRSIARRKRSEIASLHPSRRTAPSRAHSHATTATMAQMGIGNGSQYAQSVGTRSVGGRSVARTTKSDLPNIPQELPTHHNRTELDGDRSVRPKAHEVYGSYTHPVELQAGSMTDLMAVITEMKRAKVTEREITARGKDPEIGSVGYISPSWPPPSGGGGGSSEAGLASVSELEGTDGGEGTVYDGERSIQSIQVYLSPESEWGAGSSATLSKRQSIAIAMSQASSSKGSSRTLRSSTTTTR